MPPITIVVDGVVPAARMVIGCPQTKDGWGGWTVESLKKEVQKRLLDIYHADLAIGTITDEAGGALYGPDKLANLSMVPGAVLRAVPTGARPYIQPVPEDDAGLAGPIPTSWTLQMLDRAIAEKDDLIGQLASATDQTPAAVVGSAAASITEQFGIGRTARPLDEIPTSDEVSVEALARLDKAIADLDFDKPADST